MPTRPTSTAAPRTPECRWRPRTLLAALALAALGGAAAGCAAASLDGGGTADTSARGYQASAGDRAFLDTLEQRTFQFFWETTNPSNGLTPDRWPTRTFSSVAAVGFALTAYPIGVERGWITRAQARDRVLTTLRFFWNAPQGPQPAGVTGYHGFFYHFLDLDTGYRYQNVELSTIDSAILFAGALACRQYFDGSDPGDVEIRALADSLYDRADWQWASDGRPVVNMGWRPDPAPDQQSNGFNISSWRGYDEAMLLYVLALGSPTHPVDSTDWAHWTSTYTWGQFQGQSYVQFAPLFGYQYSHVWIDFRGIEDAYMRGRGIDYFQNSRRATLAQRAYAVANPGAWRGYDSAAWGLTASDGPLDSTFSIDGRPRTFHGYWARGVDASDTRDDGTIAPAAAGGSIAFAPEIVVPTLVAMRRRYGGNLFGRYGFVDAFNPTLRTAGVPVQGGRIVDGVGWFDTDYLGIDQGPMVAMLENRRSGLVWRLMRGDPAIVRGLCRAGFTGGWLAGRC